MDNPIDNDDQVVVQQMDENGFLSSIYEGSSTRSLTRRTVRNGSSPSSSSYSSSEVLKQLINIFLPTGYPHSVSPDYIDYQIYDSIQAFSSSIASLFANRAVLSAVGVGDDSATSTSALFMKVIQETVGRLGTIIFAWKLGSALEPEAKKFRYMADLVNDSAIVFDCLSPLFPGSKNLKLVMLCMSGLLRSICGVFAGGSRAALTLHFTHPVKGSVADVNAKDQSQETVITLMGMLTGSLVVGMVQGEGLSMWLTVGILLTIHLWTNYQAVWHVVMRTLNRQRTNIVFSDIINSMADFERTHSVAADAPQSLSKLVLSPKKTSRREKILEPDGLLRWYSPAGVRSDLGRAKFGGFSSVTRNMNCPITHLFDACSTKTSGYVLSYSVTTGQVQVDICLVHEAARCADLHAWVHALLVARELKHPSTTAKVSSPLELIAATRSTVDKLFSELEIARALSLAGWELDKNSIQSRPTPTIQLRLDDPEKV